RSPNSSSPILHPEDALRRRNHVLHRMFEENPLKEADIKSIASKQQLAQYHSIPLVLGTYKEEAPRVGAYFSEEIRQHIEHDERFGVENLYQRGLKVYSTLDLSMQQAAEVSLQRGLRAWDRRRGYRKPARNLVAEGIDPFTWRDPNWTNEAYAPDKLYPAVVLTVDKNGVGTRVARDQITLTPAGFAW